LVAHGDTEGPLAICGRRHRRDRERVPNQVAPTCRCSWAISAPTRPAARTARAASPG